MFRVVNPAGAALCVALGGTAVPATAMIQCGTASWYDHGGMPSADGGTIDASRLTAAHPTLPFGTRVRVENLGNGRSTTVEINDRGPFTQSRLIDVSRATAEALDFTDDGVTPVRISTLDETATGVDASGSSPTCSSE